jgi:glycerate-2-kinase
MEMDDPRGSSPPADRLRRDLSTIHRAALRAADPEKILERDLEGSVASGWTFRGRPLLPPPRRSGRPIFLFGAGKAAAALARGVHRRLAGEHVEGRIIVKYGHRLDVPGVVVEEAGHPVPDANSVAATKRLLADLGEAGRTGRVLVLLTGGASALLVAPAPGITLEDKSRVSALLLACGADIHEMNTVRKHLSAVKGGGLIPLLPSGRAAALVISDVIGDQLTSIGSGPATGDPTTFGDALGVLEKFSLTDRVPEAVVHRFRMGAAGAIPETPDAPGEAAPHHIVASNFHSLAAAERAASRLGYRTEVFGRDLSGGVHDTARRFAGRLAALGSEPAPVALLAGGELTLEVKGDGRGGRSQEFALVAAGQLEGASGVALLAAGTDGTDGPTNAAGAFADGNTWRRARNRGLDPVATLRNNDSWSLFQKTGDLLITGPTGTNVMDLMVGLSAGGAPGARST